MAKIDAGFLSHALAVGDAKFAAVDIMELIPSAHIASELVIKLCNFSFCRVASDVAPSLYQNVLY